MQTDDQTPIPGLAPAFEFLVERGAPVELGDLAIGGRRTHVPVTGGTVAGDELAGRLVGGAELLFERADGVTVVEASYLLRTGDGHAARAFGQGYRTQTGEFAGTRLTLLFEADEAGPLAGLCAAAFVAEALPGAALLSISRIV